MVYRFALLTLGLTLAIAAVQAAAGEQPDSRLSSPLASPLITDTTCYRTFVPESLMAARPVRRLHIATGWGATFTNETGDIVSSLTVTFSTPVTVTRYNPFPEVLDMNAGRTWVFSGQSLAPGERVTIRGTGPPLGTTVLSWAYDAAPVNPGFLPQDQKLLLPMPNSANLRADVFGLGGFAPGTSESDELGGLVVGKTFLRFINGRWRINADSSRVHGWVRIRRQSDFYRSLYYKRLQLTHTGTPRGFCGYDNGRAFVRQANNLPPIKQNNRLFADLAALKLNIAASQLGMTTPGFGELQYADHGHPLSEMMIRDISRLGDSMLTYCGTWAPEWYLMLDTVVQKINGAFCGAIDTVSFGDSLVFTGVRPLSAVPFLAWNPHVTALRTPRILQPELIGDDEEEGEEAGDDETLPDLIQVARNFPNPFNPATAIQFELGTSATVTVRVYDMLGREVRLLMDREPLFDGTNEVTFDASGLASGVYLYRIIAESDENAAQTTVFTGKMVLLR
jgi:hypothetical protein